jgi:hypothetical protein
MAITVLTDADYSALFKRTYGEYGDNLYGSGSEDVLESQIPKKFDFTGSDHRFPIKVGFGGGTGYSVLPAANSSKNVDVVLTRKKAYARMNLDRETIIASKGKEGAFKEATQEETLGKLKSFNRTQACALYNDGSGVLGQFSGSASGTAAAPIVTIINTGTYRFRQAYFEEGDYVQVYASGTTLQTSLFEITAVDVSTRAVTLARLDGSVDLTGIGAGTHDVVLQNSKSAAPMGLLGVCTFSTGNLYSVAYQRRWSPYLKTLSTPQLLTVDILNEVILQMDQRSGEAPNLIILSTVQMQKFLSLLEDKKRYSSTTLESKPNKLNSKASVSFTGIEYMGPRGVIPIMSSRYVRDDCAFFVNTNKMFRKHAEKFGWFDEDRTVLMRMQNDDAYEARYGGYYENFFNPLFQGMVQGLAV